MQSELPIAAVNGCNVRVTPRVIAIACYLIGLQATAKELVVGAIQLEDDETIPFAILGEDKDDVVGGQIQIGGKSFQINRVSRHGLIGASRLEFSDNGGKFEYREYVTFSSSFSEQTAVGQPWPAAQTYIACDQDYNSFIAVYRITNEKAANELGPTPYSILSDDVSSSDESTVYCFISGQGRDQDSDDVVNDGEQK